MNLKRTLLITFTLAAGLLSRAEAAPRWSAEKANAWYQKTGWLVGCNYIPRTAINELEMWQKDTFDPKTIDQELGWAEGLGFNSIRVFLHDLPWREDSKGFTKRIDRFLGIADKHHIGVMFVLLDSCWDPFPKSGKQHPPVPHRHNSGWVQSPGYEIISHPERHDELKDYVQGVLKRFGKDRRVQLWDLMNEPDNTNNNSYGPQEPKNKPELALMLLTKVFAWAKEANPSQPLTTAPWLGDWSDPAKLKPMDRLQLDESDVITYHNYGPRVDQEKRVEWLRPYGRPLICSEYMARPTGSTFKNVLPYLKEQKVGAYNWGFVSGKTQTIYPWDSWQKQYTEEPALWFHDIFRPDGSPYRVEEVKTIRELTRH